MTTLATAPPRLRREAAPAATGLPPIAAHAEALGFGSVLQYRLWCHRQGFGKGLDKDAAQRARETARRREEERHHRATGRRAELLQGFVQGLYCRDHRPVMRPVREAVVEVLADEEAHRRLLGLARVVDRYVDVTGRRRVFRQCRGSLQHLQWGLTNLARHHARWIRPLEDFAPDARQRRSRSSLFRALVRHLLARYEVPAFMDSTWFGNDPAVAVELQGWYIRLAQGGSLRQLETPIRLTKRMAHAFLHAPPRETVLRSLRWAQVIGMGGDERLARAVLRTRLGRKFEDDDFWSTVVLFLVNNAMLDPTWAGPIVDYLFNMKYAPRRVVQEGGGVVEGPPPQPDLTMKGRSATKLLRQVEAWHGDLNRERYFERRSWQPSGVRGFELEETTAQLGAVRWTVQELLSSWELAAEGTAMHHCVVSYADQCADGDTTVLSICAQRAGAAERENVMTVAVDMRERVVTQARGRYNALPNRRPKSAQLRRQPGYDDLLNRADHVLSVWVERERLRRRT